MEPERAHNAWWCDIHKEIHQGDIRLDWDQEHTLHMHPLFIHRGTRLNK